jgi:hypothetical protein
MHLDNIFSKVRSSVTGLNSITANNATSNARASLLRKALMALLECVASVMKTLQCTNKNKLIPQGAPHTLGDHGLWDKSQTG